MSVDKSQLLVLVSGFTGLLGSQIALTALQAGYKVRGVTRSQAKGELFKQKHPELADRVSFVIVDDITAPGAFDEAVKGVDYFIHSASPLTPEDTKDNEGTVLKPAINGALEALRSAAREPNLQRVILTSSVAAAVADVNIGDRAGKVYTEKDWYPVTYDQAKNSTVPYFVYAASKSLAEKAAWDFVEEKKPGFTLTTILPSIIYGENQSGVPIDFTDPRPGGTNNAIAIALDPTRDVTQIAAPSGFVDVRDTAAAHLLAAEHPDAPGERFIVVQKRYLPVEYIKFFAKEFPGRELAKVPEGYVLPPVFSWTFDGTKVQKVLGLKLHEPEETLRDTANWLISIKPKI
ncbi:hypothetical protein BS47DRAFT_1312535 [Hydnum rufescens UP504]|uniref:NAD-dependent epimerase/dehydratase domain-containing protein n=1 Tax=Hydnum rufescens UP504 TaxID=1448309 RepID=A0A9P6B7S9_9AGAM|nr:hypothetical protein BS47DRAFT_1312535 [Hydnum rufescens UP504]